MKKFLILVFAIFTFLGFANNVFASDNTVKAYFFYGDGCPHCANEEAFLESIKNKYSTLEIKGFEIYHNRENVSLMKEVSNKLNANASGIPFLVIGDKFLVGYAEGITNIEIENQIKFGLSNTLPDIVGEIIKERNTVSETSKDNKQVNRESEEGNTNEKILKLPFIGKVDVYKVSVPILAITMGVLDGFNPCAMWVLIFLISMLIGMGNRKRMWAIGTTFIVASAAVYFIFMAAWLNLIIFLGFVAIIRIIIGLLALVGGGYNLKEFFTKKDATCEVTNEKQKEKIIDKLKRVTKEKNLLLALLGVIVLAFMVNLIELVCSAGLPALFAQILSMNNLSQAGYYGYILLYIFFFMIDDLIVFIIAMTTLRITGITTKYSRYSHLIGGTLMFIIGILLIFKPEVLMFG
jgi:glutaredoxin-related protein